MAKRVLVAGATGVVGAGAVKAFAAAGWEVHGSARRLPQGGHPDVRYHAADLLNPASVHALCEAIGLIDEIAYCAINEAPGSLVEKWTDPEQVGRNGAMLAHLLDAVLAGSPGFRHISIVHGSKAYGVHLPDHDFTLPHREEEPRVVHENFYFAHEDEVSARAAEQPWSWTVFRAPMILGGGIGTNLSNFLALGVIASLARESGEPFHYRGGPATGLFQVVDADLIGRALLWSAEAPQARGEIFNISNGDVAHWKGLWPVIARAHGVAVGEARSGESCVALADTLAPRWAEAVARHDLAAPADLGAFLGESFALLDFSLPTQRPTVLSTVKLRKAGFADCEDTAERLAAWYDDWRAQRLLPPL